MNEVTLNIRLEPALKQHGAEVLQREGITVTQVVRSLFEYMEKHQTLPPELLGGNSRADEQSQHRRNLMRSMVGILPSDVSLDEAREARLTRHGL